MLIGKFITTAEGANTFALSKKFTANNVVKATLSVSALGLYKAEINGIRVGDAYMTPGFTSYLKMLQVQIYDVSDLLRCGENEIVFTVSEGWCCTDFNFHRDGKKIWAEKPSVIAELKISSNNDEYTICTDVDWNADESCIRSSSIYDGEIQDFTVVTHTLTPQEYVFDKSVLVPQICEYVKNIERIPAQKMIITPKGERVYDFGQNLTGVCEIVTPADFSGTITVRHAEILDKDGNFYTENLRTVKSTDVYTVRGAATLVPEFTFHGFRYACIEGADLPPGNVCAVVRHTDLTRTGNITCSHKLFDRLMQNAVWSQRDNFLDIPTDCPQRDERLGWTGDANAFCTTAAFNYDVRRFFRKWLADARNDQFATGEMSHVVPNALGPYKTSLDAFWSDCITMIPYKLYLQYGDKSFLAENYEAMKKYICAFDLYKENGLVCKGHQYGDWLALDSEQYFVDTTVQGVTNRGGTDVYFISNVFYAVSVDIAAKAATVLGYKEDAKKYRAMHKELIKLLRAEYITPRGRVIGETVTAQTLALTFGIVPARFRAQMAASLAKNVAKHEYHVTTGFIGTPYLLFALCDNGYFDVAEKLLINEEYPGWLYEVKAGATTIWERWNTLMPDGTPHPSGMNSFNHYAYGAVMEFVYRRVAGIESLVPGFKKVRIAPHPVSGFDEINAYYDSVNGKIVSNYKISNGRIKYTVEIPAGIYGEVWLQGDKIPSFTGNGKFTKVVTL